MSECYIMRWPKNLTAVYVNGATIRYAKDQSVYYANEVLSPGQIICTWESRTDYFKSGSSPTLPLLKNNKTYELEIKLESDNDLPVQIQINFLDANQDLVDSYRGTESRLLFTVPKGTVSYEIHLVNLKHHWIRFESLTISESGAIKRIVSTTYRQHYEWVHVRPIRRSNFEQIRLIVNKGPRSILAVSLHESIDDEQIFIYTDGQEVNSLIQSLAQTLRLKPDAQLSFEAGLSYYHLPSDFILELEEGLNQIKSN